MEEAFGLRLSRDTSTYLIGALISFGLALISIIVVTRFLSPAEFGELALLIVFAAFLTVFYNVGILQGTFSWVFGSAGEEEVEEDEPTVPRPGRNAGRWAPASPPRACSRRLAATVIVLFRTGSRSLILGDSADSELIVIAAVSGAAGAIWRMVSNILRMERKPRQFVVLELGPADPRGRLRDPFGCVRRGRGGRDPGHGARRRSLGPGRAGGDPEELRARLQWHRCPHDRGDGAGSWCRSSSRSGSRRTWTSTRCPGSPPRREVGPLPACEQDGGLSRLLHGQPCSWRGHP